MKIACRIATAPREGQNCFSSLSGGPPAALAAAFDCACFLAAGAPKVGKSSNAIAASATDSTCSALLKTMRAPKESSITVDQARANLSAVQRQLGAEFPLTDQRIAVVIEPLKETTVGAVRSLLWLLFGAESCATSRSSRSRRISRAVGLYGTLGYIVSRRQREAGWRLALGASRREIVTHFMNTGIRAVAAACAIGLALSSCSRASYRECSMESRRRSRQRSPPSS